jgi:hypothetical protein
VERQRPLAGGALREPQLDLQARRVRPELDAARLERAHRGEPVGDLELDARALRSSDLAVSLRALRGHVQARGEQERREACEREPALRGRVRAGRAALGRSFHGCRLRSPSRIRRWPLAISAEP